MLRNYPDDIKLGLEIAKVVTLLTMPIDDPEGEFTNGVGYLDALRKMKELFSRPGTLSLFVNLLVDPLSHDVLNGGEGRSQKDNDVIQLVLALIRNILLVPDPQASAESGGAHKTHTHDAFLVQLFACEIPDMLLVFANDVASPDTADWNTLLVEMFAHIFRGRDPLALVKAARSTGSPSSSPSKGLSSSQQHDLIDLDTMEVSRSSSGTSGKAKMSSAMANVAASASFEHKARALREGRMPIRHSRFGGVYRYSSGSGSAGSNFTWNKPLEELNATGLRHDVGKRRIKPPKQLPSAFPAIHGSSRDLLARLATLGLSLLNGGYERLITSVHGFFDSNDVRFLTSISRDSANLFSLSAFMASLYASSFKVMPDSFVSETQAQPTFTVLPVSVTTQVESFKRAITWVSRFSEDKDYSGLHAVLRDLMAKLNVVRLMITAGDKTNVDLAGNVLENLLYDGSLRSALVLAITKWTPRRQSLHLVKDAIAALHVFLKTTQEFTKSRTGLFKRGSKKRRHDVAKCKRALAAAEDRLSQAEHAQAEHAAASTVTVADDATTTTTADDATTAGADAPAPAPANAGAVAAARQAVSSAAEALAAATTAEKEAEDEYNEKPFDFDEFIQDFVSNKVMSAYAAVLAEYAVNSKETNYHVVRMFHRIAVPAKRTGMFFNISILSQLRLMVADGAWKLRQPENHDEYSRFTTYVTSQFLKRAAHDPMLYVEAMVPVRMPRIRDMQEIGSKDWLIRNGKMDAPEGYWTANAKKGGRWTDAEKDILRKECDIAVATRIHAADIQTSRRLGNDPPPPPPQTHSPESLIAALQDLLPHRPLNSIKARARDMGYAEVIRATRKKTRRQRGSLSPSAHLSDIDMDTHSDSDSDSSSNDDTSSRSNNRRNRNRNHTATTAHHDDAPIPAFTPDPTLASLPQAEAIEAAVLAVVEEAGGADTVAWLAATLSKLADDRRAGSDADLVPQNRVDRAAVKSKPIQQLLHLVGLTPPSFAQGSRYWKLPASLAEDDVEVTLDLIDHHASKAVAALESRRGSRKRKRAPGASQAQADQEQEDDDQEVEEGVFLPDVVDAPDGAVVWTGASLGLTLGADGEADVAQADDEGIAAKVRAVVAAGDQETVGLAFVRTLLGRFAATLSKSTRPLRKAYAWPIRPRSRGEWILLSSRPLADLMVAIGLLPPALDAMPEMPPEASPLHVLETQLKCFWRVPYGLSTNLRGVLKRISAVETQARLDALMANMNADDIARAAAAWQASRARRGDDDDENHARWTAEDLAFLADSDEEDDEDATSDSDDVEQVASSSRRNRRRRRQQDFVVDDDEEVEEDSAAESSEDESEDDDDDAAAAAAVLARAEARRKALLAKRRGGGGSRLRRAISDSDSDSDDQDQDDASRFSVLSTRAPRSLPTASMDVEGSSSSDDDRGVEDDVAPQSRISRMQISSKRRTVLSDSDSDSE